MTKILVWNVTTFGINKIDNPDTRREEGTGNNSYANAALQRFRLFQRVIVTTLPDIIVLVEVASSDTYPDDLASVTGGMQGAIRLLTYLRGLPIFNAGQWRLVPPLRVGRRRGSKPETVAVFYRGESNPNGRIIRRYFTGPNVWTGGYNGYAYEPFAPGLGGPVARPYPSPAPMSGLPDLNNMLVPPNTVARTIPANALYNGRLREDTVAARTLFREDNDGAPGEYMDFLVYRPPYLTTFTEENADTGELRNLSVFGVHSPAVAGDQDEFLVYLAHAYDVAAALGANETRVICGDFNVRLLNADGTYTGAYDPLTAVEYGHLLRPPPGNPPNPLGGYTGYFGTHIRQPHLDKASRFMWSDDNNLSYYPGYRYFGSDHGSNLSSLDNILVRPYDPLVNYEISVLNPVVGSPLDKIAPPGNAPVGSKFMLTYFTDLNALPAVPPAAADNYPGISNAQHITGWSNYGRIYSTSDHFALYANIP